MANRRLDGLFVDFYGTIVAGDRACIEGICQKVIDAHGLAMTPGELATQWGARFFTLIEVSNGPSFRTLARCEQESLATLLREDRKSVV